MQGAMSQPMVCRYLQLISSANSAVVNNGRVRIQAVSLSNNYKYLVAAMSNLDCILGKIPASHLFVTGYGDKTPVNIHHRPSTADDTDVPVPGFLARGPHSGKQDKCAYSGRLSATTYADTVCNYSTNGVAINWNAPLVYLLASAIKLQ
jgi:endoglucanase